MNKEPKIDYGKLYDSRHPDDVVGDAIAAFFNPELKDPDFIRQREEDKNKKRNTFMRLAKAASTFISPVKTNSETAIKNNQNLQIAIADSLAGLDKPDSELNKIVGIFESEDIPNFAKQYLSFNIVHPNIKEEFLKKNKNYYTTYTQDEVITSLSFDGGGDKEHLQSIKSPTLEYLLENDDTERVKIGRKTVPKYQTLIYSDLLKCEIGSGGDSIKDFVQKIHRGEDLMRSIIKGDLDQKELGQEDSKLLTSLLDQLNSLYAQVDNNEKDNDSRSNDLKIRITDTLQKIKPTSRYDLSDRVVRTFFYSNGIKNADELLQASENAKNYANQKNKKAEKHLLLKNNDLIKTLDIDYLATTIENGILAKEYLGAGQRSDYTPLDIDFYGYLATESDDNKIENGIRRSVDESVMNYMGLTDDNLCFLVVKKDDRFEETKVGKQNTDKYEVFRQKVFFEEWLENDYPDQELTQNDVDELEEEYYDDYYHNPYLSGPRDYGIRTGLPSSEIDAIVIYDDKNSEKAIDIVKNNSFYIPIYNFKGELIYSPDEYDEDHLSQGHQ